MGFASNHAERQVTLAYAGEVSAQEAWQQLKTNPDAVLVDVRTPPEWVYAGEPDLSALQKKLVKISWKNLPYYEVNAQFITTLTEACGDKNAPLFFLCRTGGRSLDAACAMAEAGYTQCYNVTDGFEGPLDAEQHRGAVAGWKAAGLAWVQG